MAVRLTRWRVLVKNKMMFRYKMAGRKQDGSEKARWWFKSKMAVRKQDGSEKT